jgi:hypothetical protein
VRGLEDHVFTFYGVAEAVPSTEYGAAKLRGRSHCGGWYYVHFDAKARNAAGKRGRHPRSVIRQDFERGSNRRETAASPDA